MLLRAVLLFALSVSAGWLVAQEGAIGAHIRTANYVIQLKVAGVEAPAADAPRDAPSVALCTVTKILMGYVIMDERNRVRVQFTSGEFAVGDQITLIATAPNTERAVSMIFDADAAGTMIARGSQRQQAADLLQERANFAATCAFELGELLPGALEEAEKAFEAVDAGKLNTLAKLSPEADLLYDFVAMSRMMPGTFAGKRPELDAATRKRLTGIALRAVCGITEDSVALASRLVAGAGNGAPTLLAAAEVAPATAVEHLRRLHEAGDMRRLLKHLVAEDTGGRALSWALDVAMQDDDAAFQAQWILIELLEESWVSREALLKALAPEKDARFPYESPTSRGMARLADEKLLRIAGYLGDHVELPEAAPEGGEASMHNTRLAAFANTPASVEYAEVYCYLLITLDSRDTRLEEMRKRIHKHNKTAASLDLTTVAGVKQLIRKQSGQFPPALRRWERGG